MAASPTFRILLHPDFIRLEQELVARIEELRSRPEDAFTPILVVVPSQRQVRRLRAVLAEAFGGLLGVEVLHHQALSYSLARKDLSQPSPSLATRAVRESLVEALLATRPASALARLQERHGSLASHLTGLLGELREAGIDPAGVVSAGGRWARELSALLAGYDTAWTRLETDPAAPWTDRAGLARRAAQVARDLPPYRAVFHYGAYELVGMNLDQLRALPSQEELTVLVPADGVARCWDYAREFVSRHFGARTEVLDDGPAGARPFIRAARAFRDHETGAAGLLSAPEIALAHAQGPEAELNFAARETLALLRRGVPAGDIGIVARSLEPYAAVAETVFARHGIPVDSSLTLPLARHPKARALLLLVRALAGGFERQTTMDLARSPYLARPHSVPPGRWRPDAWDRWSRQHRVVKGAAAWADLPRAIREQPLPSWYRGDAGEAQAFDDRRRADADSAEGLAALVNAWAEERERWERCRTAGEHAGFLRELAGRWIAAWGRTEPGDPPGSEAVNGTLAGILDDLEAVDDVAAAAGGEHGPALSVAEVSAFLETSATDARLPWSVPGGVRFLDVMQARGLTFPHLTLIGFNADLLPRRPRQDVLLPDGARVRLRQDSGRPLAVREDGRAEEWLLFAQTVAATTVKLTVTWQRADADGKARSASLFLRELARVLPGAPSVPDLLEGKAADVDPVRVPTHPTAAAAFLGARTADGGEAGLLTREEAALLAADGRRDGPEAVREFLEGFDPDRLAEVAPGLGMVAATDRMPAGGAPTKIKDDPVSLQAVEAEKKGLRYDGLVPGGVGWDRAFSATSLDRLGTCPLAFFFRYGLHVRPMDDAAEEFRFEARELGTHIHGVLEEVYREMDARGLFSAEPSADELVTAGLAVLDEGWDRAAARTRGRLGAEYPVLFEVWERTWIEELRAFVERDLRRLAGGGHRMVSLEEAWEEEIALTGGAKLLDDMEAEDAAGNVDAVRVLGIPDRVTGDGSGALLVSDYKTGGKLESRIDPREYLRGHRHQLPLYLLLARARGAERCAVELLGLGPEFQPDAGFVRAGSVALDVDAFDKVRDAFEETVALLARFAREGRFPFRSGHHCTWCDYGPACRRHHYASKLRVEQSRTYFPYHLVQRKGVRKPTLRRTELAGAEDGE